MYPFYNLIKVIKIRIFFKELEVIKEDMINQGSSIKQTSLRRDFKVLEASQDLVAIGSYYAFFSSTGKHLCFNGKLCIVQALPSSLSGSSLSLFLKYFLTNYKILIQIIFVFEHANDFYHEEEGPAHTKKLFAFISKSISKFQIYKYVRCWDQM